MQGLKLRYKFVHDCCRFYWNNTVRVLPLPYCIIKYEYCKVLYVPYYRTYYSTTVPTSTRTDAVPTTVPSTRLGGCYGQVVRDVDAPVGFRILDKPTSES